MPLERTLDAARSLVGKAASVRQVSRTGKWPLLWTLLGALASSLVLWWLIFAAIAALL